MCAENSRIEAPEKNHYISSICHHCGKVLEDHEAIYIKDPAYAENSDVKAYHCAACLQQNHPKAYFHYLKK